MVFQNYALFPHMTVAGISLSRCGCAACRERESRDRVEGALELGATRGLRHRRSSSSPAGQRQRVALARAIVFEPRILLMDEPLSALDKQLREHMQIELRQLHDRLGITTSTLRTTSARR